jgi:molybdate transport system ATP-binding protein
MTLSVSIDHRLGDFHLRAEFACEGRLTALFGASGSGKTSVVNAIAGLLNPDRARIVVDGVTLVDTQAGVRLPTHRREIGYVFQEARLFPHMNVRQNLLYAQWFGGRGARPGASFDAVVEMLGVGALLRRHPSLLSGGEKQRVAIGRALLSHPRLLLMDEPLASLDEARKQEILPFIERLRDEAKVPIVYVSHALGEVQRLADFVVMMERGVVVNSGDPQTVLRENAGGADGWILLDILSHETSANGAVAVKTAAGVFHFDCPPSSHRLAIYNRDILISLDAPSRTNAPGALYGVVETITGADGKAWLHVSVNDIRFSVSASDAFIRESGLRVGVGVHLLVTRVRPA